MGERLIVSGGGKVCAYTSLCDRPVACCFLEGAGAICAAGRCVYAADEQECAVLQLDSNALTPTGRLAGGPGASQLCLSRDGKRLYVLCSEADSLLMVSTQTGSPMVVNRVGVNPCAMAMDEQGEVIVVAGGACGEVLLLSAQSLSLVRRLATCGMVFSVAIASGNVYALSLSETMDSILTVFLPCGTRKELLLAGMPGTLAIVPHGVAAATHQAIFFVLRDASAVYGRIDVPGRAGRLLIRSWGMVMNDLWSDSLFWLPASARIWKRLEQSAKDAILV